MKKLIASIFVTIALACQAQAGDIFGETRFFYDVSVETNTQLDNVTIGTGSGGIFTNGVHTNVYRLTFTNQLGRGPLTTNRTIIFTGTTNLTNSVKLTWTAKGGASIYIIEKSFDQGTTFTSYFPVAAIFTNFTDLGTNASLVTGGSITSTVSLIPAPSVPWSVPGDLSALVATTATHTAQIASNQSDIVDLFASNSAQQVELDALDLQDILERGDSAPTNFLTVSNAFVAALNTTNINAKGNVTVGGELRVKGNDGPVPTVARLRAPDTTDSGLFFVIGYTEDSVTADGPEITMFPAVTGTPNSNDMVFGTPAAGNGQFVFNDTDVTPVLGVATIVYIDSTDGLLGLYLTNDAVLFVEGGVTFQTNLSVGGTLGYTLPLVDGSDGQVVQTDGAGQLTFVGRPYIFGGSDPVPTNSGPLQFLPFDVVNQNVDLIEIGHFMDSGIFGFSLAIQFKTNALNNHIVIADISSTTTFASNSLVGLTLTNDNRLLIIGTNNSAASTQFVFWVQGNYNP